MTKEYIRLVNPYGKQWGFQFMFLEEHFIKEERPCSIKPVHYKGPCFDVVLSDGTSFVAIKQPTIPKQNKR